MTVNLSKIQSLFSHGIIHIVLMGTKKEMQRIYASGIVAFMQNKKIVIVAANQGG